MEEKDLCWTELAERQLKDCRIFRLYEARVLDRGGRERAVYRLQAPDWVTVVPLLTDAAGRDCFLMVRQYRFGIRRVTLEFPAGLVNPGEEPAVAALRELREETGYTSSHLVPRGVFATNPAFMDNYIHFFFTDQLELAGEACPDDLEKLQALLVPVEEVARNLGKGELSNPHTSLAYRLYRDYRAGEAAREV